MDIKEVLFQWLTIFLIKALLVLISQVVVLNVKMQNRLAEELHKPIINKFEINKVYSSFKDNIWGADIADMQLISKLFIM